MSENYKVGYFGFNMKVTFLKKNPENSRGSLGVVRLMSVEETMSC